MHNNSNNLSDSKFNFEKLLTKHNLNLNPVTIDTLQVNVTKLCNQTCVHCHVDASPRRREQMDIKSVNKCLEILDQNKSIKTLDLTGGAPELNPHFDYFVKEAKKLNKHIIVRHNLTVTLDGNPQTGEDKTYLPEFFAANEVEVISSLPYYQEYFTDKQRGKGVFEKSIKSIKMLNKIGYGNDKPNLKLNFVYNPVGAFLPASQENLEKDFKKELYNTHGITFNSLYTITNMPINRFKQQLLKLDAYEEYMNKLVNAFNPSAAEGIMCRNLLSISHDGYIYDCDFNQMLQINAHYNKEPLTIFNFNYKSVLERKIKFDSHCLGCTAGAGSSCGGSTI
ncbi:MAG: radical SAM/Cys-rich domain protein [Candidatus Dadabacteria bacterium]|nr:radical SAM/Cys-rich domain protein [Candidatus Dadabacteria bacterium]NIQ16351.1 radical SAM/Cys-rich domain protein [Candidatus Dadabacteria bacterium]